MRAAALLVALLIGGCAPDLTALASDPNAICVKATSIYFTIDVERNWGCHTPSTPPPGICQKP